MGAKSGMASGTGEQALVGDGAVVCVDGELGRRGVQFGQGGERSGGRQVAGGARRAVQTGRRRVPPLPGAREKRRLFAAVSKRFREGCEKCRVVSP